MIARSKTGLRAIHNSKRSQNLAYFFEILSPFQKTPHCKKIPIGQRQRDMHFASSVHVPPNLYGTLLS